MSFVMPAVWMSHNRRWIQRFDQKVSRRSYENRPSGGPRGMPTKLETRLHCADAMGETSPIPWVSRQLEPERLAFVTYQAFQHHCCAGERRWSRVAFSLLG